MKIYKHKILLGTLLLAFIWSSTLQAQSTTYLVKLKDKANSPFSIEKPEDFLSDRAIERRARHAIKVDESDLPVNPTYIQQIIAIGAKVVYQSKWINSLTIEVTNDSLLQDIEDLPFVNSPIIKTYFDIGEKQLPHNEYETKNPKEFKKSFDQIQMINGQALHQMGFIGSGIYAAVIDAGFFHVDKLQAFSHLQAENRIIYTYDFIEHEIDVYDDGSHGMEVLSCMSAKLDGEYLGTGPGASYILLRSENSKSEFQIEEDAFIAALELADSIGVDIINSSLGYNDFDDSISSHNYQQLDGKTLRISRAAQMATEKGIVVVTSAGNEGYGKWKKITAPSDARDVITVGAVDSKSRYAIFSSRGPSADNRVKPEVVALGHKAKVIDHSGKHIVNASGSSYSSPIIAGMTASLMQAYPKASVLQIREAIINSASRRREPNKFVGYGLPDYSYAYLLLSLYLKKTENPNGIYGLSINDYTDQMRVLYQPSKEGIHQIKLKQGLFKVFRENFNIDSPDLIISSLKMNGSETGGKYKLSIKNLETGDKQKIKGNANTKIYLNKREP